jgi:hypothetical protein
MPSPQSSLILASIRIDFAGPEYAGAIENFEKVRILDEENLTPGHRDRPQSWTQPGTCSGGTFQSPAH